MELLSGFLPSGQGIALAFPGRLGTVLSGRWCVRCRFYRIPCPAHPAAQNPSSRDGKGGAGVPELFQACVWAGEPPLPQWPPAQAERGLVTQKRCLPPWTVCTFVQGGWAAFISPVVLEGPFRSSSSPRVLPGSKGARPGDSQSFGGSCQDSFQPLKTQRRWPQVGDIQ